MKHIFILNPAAGKGNAVGKSLPMIVDAAKSANLDYALHRTTGPGEAEFYVRGKCESLASGRLRFYACGGDGTVNETMNGVLGFKNAELAVFPTGTGNDLVRSFAPVSAFRDVSRLIAGHVVPIDVIGYAFRDENTGGDLRGFAANMCNIGFDSEAAAWAGRLKTSPFIGGFAAYAGGVGVALIQKKALDLTLEFDDGEVFHEKTLLTAVANGAYCGGGFKGVPDADPSDGALDVFMARDISRLRFLSLVSKYHAGTHLDDLGARDIFIYKRCGGVSVTSRDAMHVAVDGEVYLTRSASFKIVPEAVRFVTPAGESPEAERDGRCATAE
jgi:YegS/Rv2252/BmrU family lipid kinase